MIVCSKCAKENQDHYKFCLGCGSELGPAAVAAPASAAARKTNRPANDEASAAMAVSPTPPAGLPQMDDVEEPSSTARGASRDKAAAAAPPAGNPAPGLAASEASPEGGTPCPTCGTPNPKDFVFCGGCGTRMLPAAAPRAFQAGAKAKPAVAAEPASLAKLSLIRPDGSEGGVHIVRERECVIGRGTGPLFDHDSYLSPQHVRLTLEDGQGIVEDMGSLNGVFVKITAEEPLGGGDIFRIGQELLRFDPILEPQILEDGTEIMGSPNPGYWGRLSVIMGAGLDGSAFPLMGDEMVLGRERGDILFSDDGYVSGTHAKISIGAEGYFLTDLGSSNGTFVRITQARALLSGTFILIGQQLFRFEHLAGSD